MRIAQKRLLGAGVLVLVLTNAVALVGVAYNRTSPPDSVLTLTEREIVPQWSWMWREGENSDLSVELRLRAEVVQNPRYGEVDAWEGLSTYGGFGAVRWLDADKLAALGFDTSVAPTGSDSDKHYERMSGRDVLLVLELDGATRARALQDARDSVTRLERKATDEPREMSAARQLMSARDALRREEHEQSRLFVIDAGLDQATLRQRYPDRSHYAIVRGTVSPFIMGDQTSAKLYGRVTAVRCASIHVPTQFQSAVSSVGLLHVGGFTVPSSANKQPATMQLALGRRLEPWIVSAHAGSP